MPVIVSLVEVFDIFAQLQLVEEVLDAGCVEEVLSFLLLPKVVESAAFSVALGRLLGKQRGE
jgi:hypothetical protein